MSDRVIEKMVVSKIPSTNSTPGDMSQRLNYTKSGLDRKSVSKNHLIAHSNFCPVSALRFYAFEPVERAALKKAMSYP